MSNTELIHEVEESLRQEKLAQTWKEYGPYIIGGIVISILLTGFISGYRAWTHKTAIQQTTAIVEALATENKSAALADIIPSLTDGRRGAAFLTQAGLLIKDGKKEDALTVFQNASKDKTIPDIYRQLATLMAVRLQSDIKAGVQTDTDAMMTALTPLMNDKSSPWRWHAYIQAAIISAHDLNDYEQARTYLRPVLDSGTNIPPSLMERARALDHVYSLAMAQSDNNDANRGEPEG